MATVLERVCKVVAAKMGIAETEINADTNFTADLEADSLDMVEMMMALEDEFSINGKKIAIPDEESEKMLSVKDAVAYLHGIGISDREIPKAPDRNNQPQPTRKPGLPRPTFRRPWQQKSNTPQNQQQSRPISGQQSSNQPRRDSGPQG